MALNNWDFVPLHTSSNLKQRFSGDYRYEERKGIAKWSIHFYKYFPCDFSYVCAIILWRVRVCIPFRHVFLAPVWHVWVLLTQTCHVSGFQWQVINVDAWIWWSAFILQLRNLVPTLHESHINHFYDETRTRSSKSVCFLVFWSLLPILFISLICPYLWSDLTECSPPWSRFLAYRLVDTLSKG
jgi:hypothetical protein